MDGITAIIPTYNEEDNIERALKSVGWADEIIVVDSFSTDRTQEIVRQFPCAKLLVHEYEGPAAQKNWTIPQARHKWIFLLDADERCNPGLEAEIRHILNSGTSFSAFWIRRTNYFMGRKLRFLWKGDAVIRLFLRDECRYNKRHVHEEIETKGKVGHLKHPMEHHTFKNTKHFLAKMERYGEWSALDHLKKTPRVTYFHLLLKPGFRFFKHYFIQLGILDGKAGFVGSAIMAWGVFLRYIKIMEIHQQNKKQLP